MSGRKVWTREILSSADLQEYLQDQVVMRFASAAARGGAIPAPEDGMVTFLEDTHALDVYSGGWRPVGTAGWPKAQLRQIAAQGGNAGGQYVRITFQEEDVDTHDGHGTGANSDRWTCPPGQAGLYALEGVVAFAGVAGTATYVVRYEKNGTPVEGGLTAGAYAFGPSLPMSRRLVQLQPGDWVALAGMVGSGPWATAATDGDPAGSMLLIERVS